MVKKFFVLLLPLVAMFVVVGFTLYQQRSAACPGVRGIAAVGAEHFSVALATTPAEWEQGLSGSQKLPNDQGMLFLFPDNAIRRFWMKDMNFPLDIVWIDNSWHVVGVVPHADPGSYPSTFASPLPVNRVLEITAAEDGSPRVHVGDQVSFNCR